MLIQIHPENPSQRQILKVVEILRKGGVIIYPTDTVYGLGCDIFNNKAVERVARIKGIRPEKSNFSIICHDLSHLSDFARHIDNSTFKLPKIFKNKKKTIGIRIPKHNIPLEIVRELGNPILTTSIHDGDKIIEYTTDPELIHENLMNLVDLVIDGGYGHNIPSTIIDCTGESPVVVRKGLGHFEG
jgi:tRNA A37 threonylcarbamoyladenosine synthetase subunit TsaC/SUA5/YrdC